jgi:hypothetical protein
MPAVLGLVVRSATFIQLKMRFSSAMGFLLVSFSFNDALPTPKS